MEKITIPDEVLKLYNKIVPEKLKKQFELARVQEKEKKRLQRKIYKQKNREKILKQRQEYNKQKKLKENK